MSGVPGAFANDRENTPGPSTSFGKRAQTKMTEENTGGNGGGGPTFDGTGSYEAWKGYWRIEALDDPIKARKGALRSLRGPAQAMVLAGVDEDTAISPFSTIRDVFAVLDPSYAGAGINPQNAMQQLARLRQGTKEFATFLQEFNTLAAHTGLDSTGRKALLMAGVSGRLAATAVACTTDSYAGMCAKLANADRMLPRDKPKQSRGPPVKGRQTQTRDHTKLTCYKCQQEGHIQRNCPDNKPRQGKARQTETKAPEANNEPEPNEWEDIVEHSGN